MVLGLAFIVERRPAQLVEAWCQGHLLRLFGVHCTQLQTAVLFEIDGRLTGVSLTSGCTIGPILGVFFLAAGLVSWFRAFPVHRIFLGGIQLTVMFLLANQLRIAAIVASMRRWGFERGYEFSHVFLGSAITTLGFVGAVVVFVRLVIRQPNMAES